VNSPQMIDPMRCGRSRYYVIATPSKLGNYKIADTL